MEAGWKRPVIPLREKRPAAQTGIGVLRTAQDLKVPRLPAGKSGMLGAVRGVVHWRRSSHPRFASVETKRPNTFRGNVRIMASTSSVGLSSSSYRGSSTYRSEFGSIGDMRSPFNPAALQRTLPSNEAVARGVGTVWPARPTTTACHSAPAHRVDSAVSIASGLDLNATTKLPKDLRRKLRQKLPADVLSESAITKGVIHLFMGESLAQTAWKDGGWNGDPYAIVYLNNVEIGRTPVIKKSKNPEWNCKFEIGINETLPNEIIVDVLDWDMAGEISPLWMMPEGGNTMESNNARNNSKEDPDEFMGRGSVKLLQLQPATFAPHDHITRMLLM